MADSDNDETIVADPKGWTTLNLDDYRQQNAEKVKVTVDGEDDTDDDDYDAEVTVEGEEGDETTDDGTQKDASKGDENGDSEGQSDETDTEDKKKPKKRKSRAQTRIRELHAKEKAAQARVKELEKELEEAKSSYKTKEKSHVDTQIASLDAEMDTVKKSLRKAKEDGDLDLEMELTDRLSDVKLNKRILEAQQAKFKDDVDAAKPAKASETKEKTDDKPQQQIPERMQEWLDDNEWFMEPENRVERKKQRAVVEVTNDLVADGFSPEDDDFYEELQVALEDEYPKLFGKSEENDVDSEGEDKASSPSKTKNKGTKRAAATVAGNARTPTSPKKRKGLTLTKDEAAMADRLGIPRERYAKRKAQIEQSKGGWVNV